MGTFNVKVWNGSSFSDCKSVKVWNGSSWVDNRPTRTWNGSSWVDKMIYSQVYENTWTATWSASYLGTNAQHSWHTERMYQGDYTPDSMGLQKTMFGFNNSDIISKISGAKILDIQVYLANEHAYYTSGMYAYIGTHNYSSAPGTFDYSTYADAVPYFNYRGEAKWTSLPAYVGERFRDGTSRGFTLFANSSNIGYYGYFSSATGANPPKLYIKYEK